MPHNPITYLPIPLPYFSMLLLLLGVVFTLIQLRILQYAFARLGLSPATALLLLIASLLGSYINIPLVHLPERQVTSSEVVDLLGMRYVVPTLVDWPGTILAINVGGALIPIALSAYLIVKQGVFLQAAIATATVAAVCHAVAQPIAGVGIAIPTLVPALVTVGVTLLIARSSAPAVAYIAGSMGTLIGADLLNLGKLQGLGAPIASIGGAGTFDAVFLTGIMAVLLASLWHPKPRTPVTP